MTEPDGLIHQAVRLKIMASLNAARASALDFNRLKALTGATDGNLGAHLATLESAGYVRIEKRIVGKRPRTEATITRAGERAFHAHVEFLREVIDGAQD
ncbi:MAG TPA: transcriptional regulator [Croceibacterium sp.]|jgi:DNA-binding transcriptional ArsR family regulator